MLATEVASPAPAVEPIVLILLSLSLAAHALKLGDLILRPHQKRALQSRLEAATLRLDYLAPLKWCGKLTTAATLALVTGLGALSLLIMSFMARQLDVNVLGVYLPSSIARLYAVPPAVALVLSMLYITANVVIALTTGIGFAYLGTLRLFLNATLPVFTCRVALLFPVTSITVIALFLFVHLSEYINLKVWHLYRHGIPAVEWSSFWDTAYSPDGIGLVAARAFPLVVIVSVPLLAAIIVCLAMLALAVLHFAVRLCTAVGWRVVEYEKGAWAAILVVVTVALALTEASLRFGP